jgi:serine/threonine protein kinase
VDQYGNARLTDLSIAKVTFPSDWTQAHGFRGARWMAPELINPQDDSETEESPVTRQTDIYSFAMTILEV